jgi:tyrosine decarboxylase/aspartate 1-decarboxylase
MKSKNKMDKRYYLLKELDKYKEKDFNFSNGHIIGSMCTQPHPIAKEVYMNFLETNLGDPELFPGTKEIESKLIAFISNLLNTPNKSAGQIVSGGTEGNITAMWIAKHLTGKKEIIVPDSAHFSFQKIASLMDMKLVTIKLNEKYFMDIDSLEEKISSDTAAVVGVAGSTELGTIDPVPQLSKICTDNKVFLHVDAAFGGFVIPFLKDLDYNVPDFDFKLKGVSTISVDSHKMGYSAIPIGTLLVRDNKWLDGISVESNCVSSKRQASVLGTRSGGPVAAAYAVVKYLGKEGYKSLVKKCMDNTHRATNGINKIGLNLVVKPTMNVLGVKLKNPSKVVQKLTERGWKVNKIDGLSCIRIVLMPHVTKEVIDEFIPDLEKTCKELGEL